MMKFIRNLMEDDDITPWDVVGLIALLPLVLICLFLLGPLAWAFAWAANTDRMDDSLALLSSFGGCVIWLAFLLFLAKSI